MSRTILHGVVTNETLSELKLHVANSVRVPISNLLGGAVIVGVDVDPALGFSDCVADALETASILRVDVNRMGEYLCI
jgi:hypothetical protein